MERRRMDVTRGEGKAVRCVTVALLLAVSVFFNVTGMFVHGGEELRGLGSLAGVTAALLLARFAFLALPGRLLWRRLGAAATFLVLLPGLTIGTAAVVDGVHIGETGTRLYPLLVVAEGIYLSVVPEPAHVRDIHRHDRPFHVRLVRALHSCDERRVMTAVEDAVAGYGGERRGRLDLFSRVVLARFLEEGWCSADLRRQVEARSRAWLDQVQLR